MATISSNEHGTEPTCFERNSSFPNKTLVNTTLLFNWPLAHPTNPTLEKPISKHSPHSVNSLLPDSPASQQLQRICAISIFPLPSTYQTPHTTPTQTVLQTVPYSRY